MLNTLLRTLSHRRDYLAGGLMMLLGFGTVMAARRYNIGTVTHMGPGFFPICLGVVLIVIGVLIAGSAMASVHDEDARGIVKDLDRDRWLWIVRGWLCIIAGPVLFIVLGEYFGLIPATFACVLVSGLGDRTATWKGCVALAVGITVFGVLVFHYVLRVPFPILRDPFAILPWVSS